MTKASTRSRIVGLPREEPERKFVLRDDRWKAGRPHLDGYVFENEEHAQTWMAQPIVDHQTCRLVTAYVTRAACCGAVVSLRDEQPVKLHSPTYETEHRT